MRRKQDFSKLLDARDILMIVTKRYIDDSNQKIIHFGKLNLSLKAGCSWGVDFKDWRERETLALFFVVPPWKLLGQIGRVSLSFPGWQTLQAREGD